MLIEFTLENFRSFRESATLSMLAHSDQSHPDSVIDATVSGKPMRLLRSAGIFGPNASGKSAFLDGLSVLRLLILESAMGRPAGASIPVEPCLFDGGVDEPTRFEITFVVEGAEFNYEMAATTREVVSERLTGRPNKLEILYFSRERDSYKFGRRWGRSAAVRGGLARQTRPDALFLSTAAQLNHPIALKTLSWFRSRLQWGISTERRRVQGITDYTAAVCLRDPEMRGRVEQLLRAADLGVDAILTPEHPSHETGRGEILVEHTTLSGEPFRLPLSLESAGTQEIFGLAGPLLTSVGKSKVLVVDELDRSLHVVLLLRVVDLFHQPSAGGTAQLLFSCHATELLDIRQALRRDQIWFVENSGGGSNLYPLLDFKPRKGEAVRDGYLKGRYGAVPLTRALDG